MARTPVSGYERRGPGRTTISVSPHKRRGPNPGHAWRSVRRGWKHQRSGNPGRAAACAGIAILEVAAYVLFKTTGVMLLTFALVAGGLAVKLLAASGKETG